MKRKRISIGAAIKTVRKYSDDYYSLRNSKPYDLHLLGEDGPITLWEDPSRKRLFLLNGGKVLNHGQDSIAYTTMTNTYFGLSDHFGKPDCLGKAGLYKRCNKRSKQNEDY